MVLCLGFFIPSLLSLDLPRLFDCSVCYLAMYAGPYYSLFSCQIGAPVRCVRKIFLTHNGEEMMQFVSAVSAGIFY